MVASLLAVGIAGATDGLVSHWDGSLTATGMADDIHNSNDGTMVNVSVVDLRVEPGNAPAVLGDKAFSFLTAEAHIDVGEPANLGFTTSLRIALWINTPIGQDGTYLEQTVNKVNGTTAYSLAVRPDGGLRADLSGNVLAIVQSTAGGLISAATWHHIAVTFQAATAAGPGEVRMYLDGDPVDLSMIRVDGGTVTFPDPPVSAITTLYSTGSPVYIGRGVDHPDEDFDGYMDEIRMYNVAVSQCQVRMLAGRSCNTALSLDGWLVALKSHGQKDTEFLVQAESTDAEEGALTPSIELWAFDKSGNGTLVTSLALGDAIRLQVDSGKVTVVGAAQCAVHARAASFEVRYSVTDSGGLTTADLVSVGRAVTQAQHSKWQSSEQGARID